MRKKKSLGQHFLHDPGVIRRIVTLIGPRLKEHIVEIGPGAGALTRALLPFVSSLDVIELDHEVVPILQANCNNSSKLHVYNADVLQLDFTRLQAPMHVVGNLPYNISTTLLFYLMENIKLIQNMHFMLQKEVAERIVAAPGSKTYGRLSVMLQYYCKVKLLLHIGSGAFSPPPKVDSAFIRLTPYESLPNPAHNIKVFGDIVCAAFNQRRKIIANSLKKYISASQLEKLDIDPLMRPEELGTPDFVKISNACF